MRKLAKSMQGRPFAILGINTDEGDRTSLNKRVLKAGITWPMIYDGPTASAPNARRWNISSYPTLVVLDRQGKIRFRGTKLEQANAVITELLKRSSKAVQ
jgi:hypothetical protein